MSPEAQPVDSAQAALALYAGVLSATTLAAAAHSLVDRIARDNTFDRVTIALVENGNTRLLASSALDISNPQADIAQLLLGDLFEPARALEDASKVSDAPAATAIMAQLHLLDDRIQRGAAAGRALQETTA